MDGKRTLLATVVSIGLLGCNAPPGVDDPGEPQAGRAETRNIRNTEHVGYSGGAVADKIDDMLNSNDQRGAQLDAQFEDQTSGQ